MKYFVYVLFSKHSGRLYIGMTSNLQARLLSHNDLGKKGFTTRYRPWDLIYSESFEDKAEALSREKALKSGQGRAWIKRQILPSIMDK